MVSPKAPVVPDLPATEPVGPRFGDQDPGPTRMRIMAGVSAGGLNGRLLRAPGLMHGTRASSSVSGSPTGHAGADVDQYAGRSAPIPSVHDWPATSMGMHMITSAMCGDLLASFTKRRMGLAPSSGTPVLDTVPEALLPGLGLQATLSLSLLDIVLVAILFTVIVRLASPVLFRLHIRRRPW